MSDKLPPEEIESRVEEFAKTYKCDILGMDGNKMGIRHTLGDASVDLVTGEIVTDIVRLRESLEKALTLTAPEKTPVPRRPAPQKSSPPPAPSVVGGFRPAKRSSAKLRLAITGPSGSGKTASALLVARGLAPWEKIGLVDTESGSGELYVGSKMGDTMIETYNVLPLGPPYAPKRYIDAIKMAEDAGLEVVILDSLSHAWEGEGGVLEMHDTKTAASKSQNSYFAWRDVTPEHRALIDKIRGSSIHVIATMRTKTEYVIDGKTPHKVGTAPIQRQGTDYEFDVVFDLSQAHVAVPTKDRTNLFDGLTFVPKVATGKTLLSWLVAEA